MTFEDFKVVFTDIVNAFGAKADESRAIVYFREFQHLTVRQWDTLCGWSRQSCDRFPTIKDLYRGMYENGMVKRPKLSDLDRDAYTVVCSCGSAFVFHRNTPDAVLKCPGDGCHLSYDRGLVVSDADRYNVYWADIDIRAALRSKVSKSDAMKQIYGLLGSMHLDVVPERKGTLKDLAARLPKEPALEEMFADDFDGRDARPDPFR